MSTFQEPPPPSSAPTSQLQKPQSKNLPLPLDFPSINDDVTEWNQSPAPNPPDVAWNRPSNPPTPAPPTITPDPDPPATTSFIAKIKALFVKKKPQSPQQPQQPPKPTKSPITKAKELVCKLPDPTLIFVFQVSTILIIHTFKPAILRTWPARIIIPLLLIPNVIATALWRRTIVLPATPGKPIASIVKPIPDAAKVVTQGRLLRTRELALEKAEHQLSRDQAHLDQLRKTINGRLPPQLSIASLLNLEDQPSHNSSSLPS